MPPRIFTIGSTATSSQDFFDSLRAAKALGKLRFLLYPKRLMPDDLAWIKKHDDGVKWLG